MGVSQSPPVVCTSSAVRRHGAASANEHGSALSLSGFLARFAFDRLAGGRRDLRLRRPIFLAAHAVLETFHGASKVGAQIAQLLGAENQNDYQQYDQPMPDAERTHRGLLS